MDHLPNRSLDFGARLLFGSPLLSLDLIVKLKLTLTYLKTTVAYLCIVSGSVVVAGSLTVSHGHGVGGFHAGGIHMPGGPAQNAVGRSSANNSGICQICHKSFRQLRSHIADVHIPTPTPCPLCGKIFSSKHKMFGHKYRSCPNRTKNLVRHLELLDHNHPHAQQQLLLLQQQQQLQQLTTTTPPPAPPLPPVSQHY